MSDPYIRYTSDIEVVSPDEAALIDEILVQMAKTNREAFERHRHAVRDAHAKSHGFLKGELEQMVTKHNPDLKGTANLAGRIGAQSGNVSELTAIARLKPGGAARLRRIFGLVNGNFDGAQKVGTLHDMRFVFFDDDTRILFATAYDGDWDSYINDFATKIPDLMDLIFASVEGWPGIASR